MLWLSSRIDAKYKILYPNVNQYDAKLFFGLQFDWHQIIKDTRNEFGMFEVLLYKFVLYSNGRSFAYPAENKYL